ncbi:MAG TPA: alginate lyase family protein, partial [Pyrinomonadaceae bacterium]
GFGEITFDKSDYWRRDPLTGIDWGLDYHADVPIYTPGSPDIRVLWELSRFGQVLMLGRAFAVTSDEKFAETFFRHLEEWTAQNPYARGANWRSPMDVIMRAVNIAAAFELVKNANCCTPERAALVLKIADTHCRFTFDNREFSYIATGNHYITNVAGLFFVATLLPELEHASEWQTFGLNELLRECKKQVLPDGADYESSTGYHKFVTEILMTCLLVAERNNIEVAEEHRDRCKDMLRYLRAVIRPDGGMPLVGDCDGSQFLPIVRRDVDDTTYLLDLAAVICDDAEFKISEECLPEVLWLFGKEGVERFKTLAMTERKSEAFRDAGTYILRHEDLYVMLNANDVGLKGRGSHSHNDALSIEISALGHAWIVDPGSYVYNLDREARHRFRSTAAHSTVMIDEHEQNKIEVDQPFVSLSDARPELLEWNVAKDRDTVTAEHHGHAGIVYRRKLRLDKAKKKVVIQDEVEGKGHHDLLASFTCAPDVEIEIYWGGVNLRRADGSCLSIGTETTRINVEDTFFSVHYGASEPTKRVVFVFDREELPKIIEWEINPYPPGTDDRIFWSRSPGASQ